MARAKEVFVIGAGFSCPAKYPLQSEIWQRIAEFNILDAPVATADEFLKSTSVITPFLRQWFPNPKSLSLEDVFTLLDDTVENEGFFGGRGWRDLDEVRSHFKRTILFLLHQSADRCPADARRFYQQLAAGLLRRRVSAGLANDPLSVITLNWDTLFEDSVYECLQSVDAVRKADIDYCCYTTPLAGSPHTPSITQRAAKKYNLKVLKLHGSANWLRCPNCGRLFTGLGMPRSRNAQYVLPHPCPTCSPKHPKALLEPFFITPTFLKVFDNPHIQSIWQNAYVELSEASEVTFIGYSLPQADYHFRTLLRRAISKDVAINVVLKDSHKRLRAIPEEFRTWLPGHRFSEFFAQNRVRIYYGGVKAYFADAVHSASANYRYLRLKFRSTRGNSKDASH